MSLMVYPKIRRRFARLWLLTLLVTTIVLAALRLLAMPGFPGGTGVALVLVETLLCAFAWRNWNNVEEKLGMAETDLLNLRSIIDASQDAVIDLTADGLITSWSKRARQLYGYSAKQV